MRARAIMVLGTSSHVGKSLLAAALCRVFAEQGVSVAPFKSQNMSLNSAATLEGLEIGRAQALQAEAAGVPASVHMNPILLKPAGNMTSQVVVRGKIWGRLSASDYHRRRVEELLPIVRESYEKLAVNHQVIILEGAGSPAEINLKQHDIVNMRMAEIADAQCILVGDIDRGGVFASLYGTVQLLDPAEQNRIAGFVINKFRGDLALLQPGIRMIEDRLRKRCLGVVPYIRSLALDEEDSLGLPSAANESAIWTHEESEDRPLRIAVLAFPSFSNFTDFDALRNEPSVSLQFCQSSSQLALADIIILPGSKQTVEDLLWLKKQGLASSVLAHAAKSLLFGICGGMQMLGRAIVDPHGIEHGYEAAGLGLLPLTTRMNPDKTTRKVTGRTSFPILFGQPVPPLEISGYEIHVGETVQAESTQEFAILNECEADGCISPDTRVIGTYLHGIFDEDGFRHAFLAAARVFHQLAPAKRLQNWRSTREESFQRLAHAVRESLDLDEIFNWAGLPYRSGVQKKAAESIH
ncbi:MAG TPA: cobyric acid synthase [Acidobacteriaceae bacterium]|nr:cobyric acid synthase [Acidobacteriaceae bacterium]